MTDSALVHSGCASVPTEKTDKPADHVRKFRAELTKIMPGYQWTVHRALYDNGEYLDATGIQSSGFNRLSTLSVIRRNRKGVVEYEVKSAGFGKRASWLHTNKDGTLARALRGLQAHYEDRAATYRGHALSLQNARVSGDFPPSTAGTERSEVSPNQQVTA